MSKTTVKFQLRAIAQCDNEWMRTYNDGTRSKWACANHDVFMEEFSDSEFNGTESDGFRERAMAYFCDEGFKFVEVPARPTLANANPEPETKCLCRRCEEFGTDPEPDKTPD